MHKFIDKLHLEDLQNEIHPSMFDVNEKYDVLIVRLPVIGEELKSYSTGFLITEEGSYLYDRAENEFKKLDNRFEDLHDSLDKMVDKILKSFAKYADTVADMEELLYTNKFTKNFMTEWLWMKSDLLRIERILMRTSLTVSEVVEHYSSLKDFPINHYMDLHEHLERVLRSASLQLSKLDYLYNFHSVRTNEKMNHLIYILTIMSAIFLPLNLAVGFFGMNTSGLPFTQGNTGTLGVTMILGFLFFSSIVVAYFIQKKN